MVEYLSNIRFATGDELDELTEEDRLFARFRFTSTGEAVAVVFLGRRCRPVPLDELTEEDVDENLIDGLEILVGEGPGSYVIPDTEEARRALEQRLRNS